jgi:hypothetical protein
MIGGLLEGVVVTNGNWRPQAFRVGTRLLDSWNPYDAFGSLPASPRDGHVFDADFVFPASPLTDWNT